ncbi:MAG: hypothetical protein K9N48_07725 [Verrucomicrobia bacterium]|nr:hypothetical protein [Verrucomicrobiota bacterium]MCF7708083.1 hypothetical protein [Verrucomicrobiota bacterium]
MKITSITKHFHTGVLIIAISASHTLTGIQSASGADAGDAASSEPVVEYDNWANFSVGSIFIEGDEHRFQEREKFKSSPYGGLEDFHWETQFDGNYLEMDGHAIFDNDDYHFRFELVRPETGYFRFGYHEYRTWYDGSGGFFPASGRWFSLFDENLHMDRGRAWVETGLLLPDWPEISLKYSHEFRDGRKSSTVWGDSTLTSGLGSRGFTPTFLGVDEKRDIIEAKVTHTIDKTDLGLGLRYEFSENDDTRNIRRNPSEATDRHVTSRDEIETDLFNIHAYSTTRFNERVFLSSGYAFTTMDTDLSGSRIYGSSYDPVYDPLFARRQFNDSGFLELTGGSRLDQHTMNLNLMLTPKETFSITPSIRVEKEDRNGMSGFTRSTATFPFLPTGETDIGLRSEREMIDVSERLEARYTGFTNWVLYARGDWTQGQGDLSEREFNFSNGTTDIFRETDDERFTYKYTAGANWYPLRQLNIDLQYYHKIHDTSFDHELDSTGNAGADRYPAYIDVLGFDTDDANIRFTYRILRNLTSVSRYDFQISTVDQTSAGLSQVQSSEITTHIIGQTLTYIPWSRMYLQAGVNYVIDETESPADEITGAVPELKNNYWNGSLTTGYILTDATDIQAHYFYYRADNYYDNAGAGMPYGATSEEHGITTTLTHKFSDQLSWTLKYGFFTNNDETSGGHNDYDAHLVYSGIQYMF